MALPLATARADFQFLDTGGSTGTVIQFEQHITAPGTTSLFGDLNSTPLQTIDFLSLAPNGVGQGTENIGTTGSGQADVTCTANCGTDSTGGANGMQLTGLEIRLKAGLGALQFIGNLDFGEGSAFIVVQDQFGNAFVDVLGNGQNFFTINAINNEVITDIKIFEDIPDPVTGQWGWNDLKQPRIGGLCTIGVDCPVSTAVPEPGTLAILGTALTGMWFLRRRR